MPTGPNGQKRPADVIGAAVMVAKIATGAIRKAKKPRSRMVNNGLAGARARAEKLSPEARSEIANKAAAARWE